jgi:hypothetical protein
MLSPVMDDPGLWLAFGATLALGYLVFGPMARRQEAARRGMSRHSRGVAASGGRGGGRPPAARPPAGAQT